MALENKKINLNELDFNGIKNNLKEFLRGQSQFSDYDFDGSALSVLVDLLAYNTHYNALYNNFALNEMFLDSASKRNSVVSIAKQLGYIPYSATSSEATLNISVINAGAGSATLTIPKYSPFTSTVNGKSYVFYTMGDVTASKVSNAYYFTNIKVKEGTILNYRYTVGDGVKYLIPNTDVDMNTLVVTVRENSSSSNTTTFVKADTYVGSSSTASVYFVKEVDDGYYEIEFGDGVVGQALSPGNVVEMTYLVTNKADANGCKTFAYTGRTLVSGSSVITTTIYESSLGSDQESIDSIKFNAPRAYSSQDRAITANDYKSVLYRYFNYIETATVWGGEDNDPPMYGRVLLCVKPTGSDFLTQSQKQAITAVLNSKNATGITPVITDPEYIDISLDVTVYYDPDKTSRSNDAILSLVNDTIKSYEQTDLGKFESVFRFSKLSRLIDVTEEAILNNVTKPVIRKAIRPKYNVSSQYKINIITPIYSKTADEPAVISSPFYIAGSDKTYYLADDGAGNMHLYYIDIADNEYRKVVINPTIGTIDYSAGMISISNLNISSLINDAYLRFIIKPESYDIVSAYNQIIRIDYENSTFNAIADKSVVDAASGKNYIFTSSRS